MRARKERWARTRARPTSPNLATAGIETPQDQHDSDLPPEVTMAWGTASSTAPPDAACVSGGNREISLLEPCVTDASVTFESANWRIACRSR